MNFPLLLGTKVEPWGTISGIYGSSREERYYMFAEKGVALIQAQDVELNYVQQYAASQRSQED